MFVLSLLADENFNNHILRGVRRRLPGVDFIRVQDVGLDGKEDPFVLEWAAKEAKILVTHDVATIPDFVEARLEAGLAMPGVFFVPRPCSIAEIIEEIVMLVQCSKPDEWVGRTLYLPSRY